MNDVPLFDMPPAAAENQSGDRTAHAHTGSTCEWCATHPTGAAAARAALDAARSAKLEWIARADEWLKLQKPGTVFTADDLVAMVGLPLGYIQHGGNNATGALFRSWSNQGLITVVGYDTSTRKSQHGALLRRWAVQ